MICLHLLKSAKRENILKKSGSMEKFKKAAK